MLNSVCDEGTHTRIFLLTSSTCISPSDEIEELLHSLDEDFDGFKRTEWKSVETLFKVF